MLSNGIPIIRKKENKRKAVFDDVVRGKMEVPTILSFKESLAWRLEPQGKQLCGGDLTDKEINKIQWADWYGHLTSLRRGRPSPAFSPLGSNGRKGLPSEE